MPFKKVLLIDDDEEDTEIFCEAAMEVSPIVRCTVLHEARSALSMLKSGEVRPDVIFLDLNMPIMSGMEFLEQVKKHNELKSIPVIIFSTSSNPDTKNKTKALGALDFVTKPTRFDQLINILTPMLR